MGTVFYMSGMLAAAAAAFLAGFWLGKHGEEKEQTAGGEAWHEAVGEQEKGNGMAGAERRERRGREHHRQDRKPEGWAIGSPAVGEVSYFNEGSRRGILIRPQQGMLYAPEAGKVTRLYPTGNAFRLKTDSGIELLLQAGLGTEELEGLYYRPRVVQNEIVHKGKLLLEYDIAAIAQEGYDTSILMTVEEPRDYRDIAVTDVPKVKIGEDVLWVCRQS